MASSSELSVADALPPAPPSTGRRGTAVGVLVALGFAAAVLAVSALAPGLGVYAPGGDILAIDAAGPAARGGFEAGDAIVAIDGTAVRGAEAHRALTSVATGATIELVAARDNRVHAAAVSITQRLPWGSAAGVVLACILLALAVIADRGVPGEAPRVFVRASLVYVAFLAGAFSFEVVLLTPALAIPWFFAMALAAPATCHFMLLFPAGEPRRGRRLLAALYAPPLAFATLLTGVYLALERGRAVEHAVPLMRSAAGLAIALAAGYLTAGAVARGRRLRRKRDEIDPLAARWLHLGGAVMAIPLLTGAVVAVRDIDAFFSGGFLPYVAVTMVGGAACVVLAMTRVPFGDLDRRWRRSSGHLAATVLASASFLGFVALAGGAASAFSGGSFATALAATLVAAILFGPVRARMQRRVDERFDRERSRVRALLFEAVEVAAATLDLDELVEGVAQRVQTALAADGVAVYQADEGVWLRRARAGRMPLEAALGSGEAVGKVLDESLGDRRVVELSDGVIGAPLTTRNGPLVLAVAPDPLAGLDEGQRELLRTVGAQLSVAIENARAHTRLRALNVELQDVNEKLQLEYERAERRRKQIARLKQRVEQENRELLGQLASRDGSAPVIGSGLAPTFELVQKVARSEATALVRGETGVGKELIARAIHAGSPRRAGPFVVVDCSAIASGIFESTLFGHVKGAFTGAIADNPGAFRSARGGTVFLDELGELPRELQPKLLRVLQEREVRPVGADSPVPVDVRVVAGTNRDLVAEVAAGNFRRDLLYRLQVVEIEVPPLRQRRGDIPELANAFLDRIAQRSGRPRKQLSEEALEAMRDHPWPGNVRELDHAMEAAVVYSESSEILASDLPIFDRVFRARAEQTLVAGTTGGGGGLRQTLEDLERERLVAALAEHDGNRTRTARALGMSRGALLRRIQRYGL